MAETIPPQEVRRKLEEGAGYVDVRTPGEFAAGHVPGAVNIPLDRLQERYEDLPKEGGLVIGCAAGSRSAQAVKLLEGNVQCELFQLEGGYQAWQEQGLPIQVADYAPWSLERQAQFAAGSIALAGLFVGKVIPPVRKLSWLVSGGLVYAGASGNCYLKKLLVKAPWNQEPEAWAQRAEEWKHQAADEAKRLGNRAGDKAGEYGQQLGGKVKEVAQSTKEKIAHRQEDQDEREPGTKDPAVRI